MHGQQARSISWQNICRTGSRKQRRDDLCIKTTDAVFYRTGLHTPGGKPWNSPTALDGEYLEVTPDADGGVLELGEQKFSLVRGETRRVKI